MATDPKVEAQEAVEKVLASTSTKKLVVAGPGAGKTFLFKKLLGAAPGVQNERLVLTFVNTLKEDLERSLGDLARVFTLHGYCQSLLPQDEALRAGLSADFVCYPGLRSFIEKDWEILKGGAAPQFIKLMRTLECSDELGSFYMERCDYYDAIDFDDSVYRVILGFRKDTALIPTMKLTLVDEFQDFNAMEAEVIAHLADKGPIVMAGDDDQALYSGLRSASWDYIRGHYAAGEYETFHLPFCMRCPQVVVDVVGDVLAAAKKLGKLIGRIEKPFRFYEPLKGDDSKAYPTIDLVKTSVQSKKANYAGKVIEERLRAISAADIAKAEKDHEPVALIIGSKPYLPQVEEHLIAVGLLADEKEIEPPPRERALKLLKDDPDSNLGWRIILSLGDDQETARCVREAYEKSLSLGDTFSEEERAAVLKEAAEFQPVVIEETARPETAMNILTKTYEGSKGLSAQHVFLLGLHAGDLPRNAEAVTDMEICKFLVGLTRTKKKCTIIVTKMFGGLNSKTPSVFLKWIRNASFTPIEIDAGHWKKGVAKKA